MTSRERTLTAIRRGVPDRAPLKLWGAGPWHEPTEPSYKKIFEWAGQYSDPTRGWGAGRGIFLSATDKAHWEEAVVRESVVEGFDEHTRALVTPAGTLTSVSYVSRERKPGYTAKHLIETVEDAKAILSIPYEPIQFDAEAFRKVEAETGDRAPVQVGLADPMYTINAVIGSELFALWSIEERDLLHELIGEMARRELDLVERMLAEGIGPLFGYVGPELCIPPLQSPSDFRDLFCRYMKPVHDAIHEAGGLVWVHCHGDMKPVYEDFIAIGTDCLNPCEPPPIGGHTLAELKEKVAGRMALEGNVESGAFQLLSHDEMRQTCIECMEQGKPGGGFIYCATSDHSHWPVLSEHLLENFRIFVEVGIEHGKY